MCGGADQGYALANSPRAMARLRKPRRRMAWSVDNASTFAAQKEFKLLQLLSTDKKAFATARRLGLFLPNSKQQQPQTTRSGAAGAAASARRMPDGASGRQSEINSRQRRSAARSARRHSQVQVHTYTALLLIAVLYVCRLRRRCRLRADLADLDSLEGASVHEGAGDTPLSSSAPLGVPGSKRVDRPPSSASSSVASAASSSSSAALLGGFYRAECPPALLGPGCSRKQQRKAAPPPPYAGRM